MARAFFPTTHRNLATAGIETDRNGVTRSQESNEFWILECSRAENNPSHTEIKQRIGRCLTTNTATSLNRHINCVADCSDDIAITRRTRSGSVKVDHMDPSSAGGGKLLRLRNRIVVIDGLTRVIALVKTNGSTIEKINCGIEIHQAPTFVRAASTKPRKSSRPTAPDFSG